MNYKLSPQAGIQLEEIFLYTAETWDTNQAEIYHRKFEDSFELLTDFPYAGAPSDEIKVIYVDTDQVNILFFTRYVMIMCLLSIFSTQHLI